MQQFFIIDGNAYIHRAYHALPPLTTSSGFQVNAVYGFTKLLLKIKDKFNPDFIAVCFDYPAKNFRHELFKEYKANRKPLDEELKLQMPLAREAAFALSITNLEVKGYEADDLISALAQLNKQNEIQTIIVTGDKDILQIVEDDKILVWDDSKDIMFDEKKVEEKFLVTPKQLADILALKGDSSDNVPGITGIGNKTAVKLIKEFETLDKVLAKASSIKGNTGKLIQAGKEQAILSRKLVELNRNAPVDYDLNNFKNEKLDIEKASSFFKKYEFKSLEAKYNPNTSSYESSIGQKADSVKLKYSSEIISDPNSAREIANFIETEKTVSLKTVISDGDSLKASIVGVSLSILNKSFYFPIAHADITKSQISFNEFKNIFAPILACRKIKKVGYDLKQERNIYKMVGVEVNNLYFDVMLADYCLDPSKQHDILSLSQEELAIIAGDNAYLGKASKKISFADSSIEETANYANSISVASYALYKLFATQIEEKKRNKLFFDMEMPLIEILSEMEIAGIKIDSKLLHKFGKEIAFEQKKIEENIFKIAGEEFNINSPKQLSVVLFDKLNLPVQKKTKIGYSTDESVLKKLSQNYEIPREILNYRELQKLKSTYIEPIELYCSYYGDRIHTVYNQAVTVTGRLSSSEPNLQNIPIKSEYGKAFRRVFIAEEGKIFISADYSQIDLRALAHFSNDEKLISAFKNGEDIHSATAREIFNIEKTQELPDNLRYAAKSINFGIIYGMSPFGLSKQLGISLGKAKEYIEGYFQKYAGVKLWMKEIVERTKKDGYVSTLFGRVRYVPELKSSGILVKNAGERIALNMPVQGTSADIIKLAMLSIYHETKINNLKSEMILQIHDDLLFEVPLNEKSLMLKIIKNKMENAVPLNVPLSVTIKTGYNWGDMKLLD
ncbi:MAG: DNA polymerase I [Elusimicrobiota bacterium]|jgi:DNA polymerase-1|nr:DNA polymerase I [Elusimicrobiota bacterium]